MKLINSKSVEGMLCFDIETAPQHPSWTNLSKANPRMADLWAQKHEKAVASGKWDANMTYSDSYLRYAALYPEFGQVVCISFGRITRSIDKGMHISPKSIYGTNLVSEFNLIVWFSQEMAKMYFENSHMPLCGHNIRKFDIVFLVRRMMILGIQIPTKMMIWNQKPWESDMLDTMEAWNMGVFGADNVSLDVLTAALNIASPKTDMDGSQVGSAFFRGEYEDIAKYCEQDVVAVAKVAMHFAGKPGILKVV